MKIKITCRPRYNPWLKKYLNTKTFSKMLALGVLINSVPINSFAGILSEDGRYETFEGDNITIDNILEEDKVDAEIEGNTLINIIDYKEILATNTNWKYSGSSASIKQAQAHGEFQDIDYSISKPVEKDKEYTLFINVTKNTMINEVDSSGNVIKVALARDSGRDNTVYIRPSEIGIIKYKFSPTEVVNDKPYVTCLPNSSGEFEYKDFMIIEGDYIDKDIEYFEGMKSVGQDDKSSHKIEISSSNGNLFNESNSSGMAYENGRWVAKKSGLQMDPSIKGVALKPNKNYTIIFKKLDNNTSWIGAWLIVDGVGQNLLVNTANLDSRIFSFKTPVCREVSIMVGANANADVGHYLEHIIIEEGNNFSGRYIKGNIDKKEIILKEPLRALPNGTKDRIIKRNGQWVIERNCGEVLLDGSENWGSINSYRDGSCISFHTSVYNRKNGRLNMLSDKFNTDFTLKNNEFNQEGIFGEEFSDDILIAIDKSKLKSYDINSFKNWLSENPVKVVYQLETPIYEPLNIDSTINTYLDTTHISTNSTIPANLKITVDRVANRAKEYSELAKETPTIENISLARMWTNLMRESILKDEFQDNIDNITEIAEMTLDRKIASANIDVYIKSENMLMMNLSTNSITFEDFSGVEDMVKENAVNISINSSLPYNLNAYLATEIQSSDKSNTMNKDILSIKDNSELDYQTFSSINDKVVLKSNCDSGNDKQHNINLKLNGGIAHEKDVYKTTIKFEAEQQ